MSATVTLFNNNNYVGASVDADGRLWVRWGNPPTQLTPVTDPIFKPHSDLSIGRITYDPNNPFYKAYFITGVDAYDHPVMVVNSGQWTAYT